MTAAVSAADGRRTTASARLVAEDDPGRVLVEADGLFVALRPGRAAEVFAPVGREIGAWTTRGEDE